MSCLTVKWISTPQQRFNCFIELMVIMIDCKRFSLKGGYSASEPRLTADDLTEQLLRCVSEERSTAHQELVQDDPHGPPVHRLPVALTQNHLRGDILWGATHLERNRQIGNQRQRQQQQIKPPKDANFMQKKKKTGKMPINSTTSYICAS